MNSLQQQHVLILGLGASGLAMARWCAAQGAEVTVADTRAAPPNAAALLQGVPVARLVTGPFTADLLTAAQGGVGVSAVFKSPGLTPAEVATVFIAARASQISTGGELSLFSQALASLKAEQNYTPKVLAITGTNGKTTVTALTALLLRRAGLSVAVAGNIGPSLLDTLQAHITANTLPVAWVLELSSFQLEDAGDSSVSGFDPLAACILNLTQDHLDWHGDMTAYAAAKLRIFGPSTLRVCNRSDTQSQALLSPAESGGASKRSAKTKAPISISFGADAPQRAGDFGLASANGIRWLVRAQADESLPRQRASTVSPAAALPLQTLMPADALHIRGTHNALNALAALALASSTGCALAPLLHGLRDYRGEPHRLETVAVLHGVHYVDDSKGTNVGATVAALEGVGEQHTLVAILGGDGKGQDFAPLAAPIQRHARAAVLIGRDAPQIRAALAGTGVPLHSAGSLEDAVQQAAALAQTGDAVLLSPACASFDMFNHYVHRAEVFRAAVQALAGAAAQPLEGAL